MALAPDAWLVHAVLPRSLANGPGERFVIWTQGCSLGCEGCFNPRTHGSGGRPVRVEDMVDDVLGTEGIEGITITGGEPLEQPRHLAEFCREIRRRRDLGIVLLTGFTRPEIEADRDRLPAAALADMVIAGRYNARLRLGRGLRGSANKEYWAVTGRYAPADFDALPDTEVVIEADGTVLVTGMRAWQEE
ncbi:4Fe-4S single cluster domain-containing protein [Actinomadura sp. NPDC047616]|uniref:4Fe-4S single cluster domain-containing protein n=1 Tax=Actinomadura sp. NPDC047616 TaxID=3155914 RepID=UPI0033FCFEB9